MELNYWTRDSILSILMSVRKLKSRVRSPFFNCKNIQWNVYFIILFI